MGPAHQQYLSNFDNCSVLNEVAISPFDNLSIMKTKIQHASIFAISAMLPVPFVLLVLGLIDGSITSGSKILIRHTEMIVFFIVLPSSVAFVSAFLLVNRITYQPEIKNNNRKSWIFISLGIVLLSLLLWAVAMTFFAQSHEKWIGFQLAFYAGTLYSWALYPFGLLAGYFVWRIKRRRVG